MFSHTETVSALEYWRVQYNLEQACLSFAVENTVFIKEDVEYFSDNFAETGLVRRKSDVCLS